MRVLAAIGALLFAYLALIPGGLILSVWDSACSGGSCETSLFSRLAFTVLYGLCLGAVLGTAVLFAGHALRGTLASQERLPRALMVSAFVIGGATFVLFCVAYPLGGALVATIAALAYTALRLRGRDTEPPAPHAPELRTNGNGRVH